MIIYILLFAFGLRLVSLNQSLWLDEATTALVSRMSWSEILNKFLPGDFHPPLYYWIIKIWAILFGSTEMSLRMPSVIFGVLTVYFVYLIAKNLSSKKLGLTSAVIIATSGLHIYYSQEARMYSLACLLVTMSVYFFIKNKWSIFAICLLALGLTDYVSLFMVPVFFILGFKQIKKVLLSQIPLILGFGVWMPIFVRQVQAGVSTQGSEWWNILGTATFKNFALIPIKFILGRISFDNKLLYGFIGLALVSFFGYLIYKARKFNRLIWAWLILPVFLGLAVSIKIPTLAYFRFLFSLPAFYILIADGIWQNKKIAKLLLVTVLILNLSVSAAYLFNPKFHREDWRLAAKTFGQEKIVFPANSQKEALNYYGKADQIALVGELGSKDKEIWLSRYVWEIFDQSDSTRKEIETLGYNKTLEANFNGVVFWKYVKN